MIPDADQLLTPRFFFTEPWEPIVVRRGDALGMRALADQFADAVAPDLSNRVRDGRWVTILAWCLAKSHDVFHASGGRSVATPLQQRERYAWLRPLELMWVARTIAVAEAEDDWKGRSLSGQRRVQSWWKAIKSGKPAPSQFGMKKDQFRAYRQTGLYGGYRLAFRRWPGMTVQGDGWTPGKATRDLEKWLDHGLGRARRIGIISPQSAKLNRGKEHQFWLRNWPSFHQGGKNADENTLPRPNDNYDVLPEADLLKPLIFGRDKFGTRREKVARAVSKSTATDHLQVCEHLSDVFADEDQRIALLPRFSRLADAGMAVMDFVASELRKENSVAISHVAKIPEAAELCVELVQAAQGWPKAADLRIRHLETADRFAEKFKKDQPEACLRALLQHHELNGGGLRWFVLRNNRIELSMPPRSGTSRYRFRLWPLCRLATQCGVLNAMPSALLDDDVTTTDEESE